MTPKITVAAPPPVVVHIVSSAGGLTLLVTFLVGAATALAVQLVVQFYVVPKVEKRKRREDHWERDVRELGELLAMSLTDLANDAQAAQWMFRALRDDESDEHDPAPDARPFKDAREATSAYVSLIGSQVDWLADRVLSINRNAPEITRFQRVAQDYRRRAIFVMMRPEDDNRTDTTFDEEWDRERAARQALIEQVKLLADLPHPPRTPWRARLKKRGDPAPAP